MTEDELAAIEARAAAAQASPLWYDTPFVVRFVVENDHVALVAALREMRAAARSVVNATIKVVPQTHLDRDAVGCWCCDRWIHLPDDRHDDGCPVGQLAAFLDGSDRDE